MKKALLYVFCLVLAVSLISVSAFADTYTAEELYELVGENVYVRDTGMFYAGLSDHDGSKNFIIKYGPESQLNPIDLFDITDCIDYVRLSFSNEELIAYGIGCTSDTTSFDFYISDGILTRIEVSGTEIDMEEYYYNVDGIYTLPDGSLDHPWHVGESTDDVIVYYDGPMLSVIGYGDMMNFDTPEDRPWNDVIGDISFLSLEDGITSIGSNAFYGLGANLADGESASIYLPRELCVIGDSAFEGANLCSDETVTLDDQVWFIGSRAFAGVSAARFDILSSDIDIGEDAFEGVTADVFVPYGWDEAASLPYGGDLTYHTHYSVSVECIYADDMYYSFCTTWIEEGDSYHDEIVCEDGYQLIYSAVTEGSYTLDETDPLTIDFTPADNVYIAYIFVSTNEYTMLEGSGSKWERTSGEGLTFRSDAEYDKYLFTAVDGEEVDESYLEVSEGSTVVLILPEFLDLLADGEHTITIYSVDGSASAVFTLGASSPQTGETFNLEACMALTAIIAFCAAMYIYRKKIA